MRTLILLTTLLLLALHTQAESPQGSTKEAPDEEQDISVFFGGDKGTALQDAGERRYHARDMEERGVGYALNLGHPFNFITSLCSSFHSKRQIDQFLAAKICLCISWGLIHKKTQ